MKMFEKEAKERARDFTENKERQIAYECGFLDGADRMRGEMQKLKEDNADLKQSLDWANERESEDCKRIAELEEQISVLLSCKNCPENKGGYICKKEYENKCLSQKIQYIKELKDDNKVMADNYSRMEQKFYDNLSKAKGLLRELYSIVKVECSPFVREEHKNILMGIKEFLQEE
jgi:hypothetical protein